MNLAIREAMPDDLPAVLNIEKLSFPHSHWGAPDFQKYDCAVAEIDGQIAGFLVSREVASADLNSPPEREILNIAVDPQFRRMGVATALLRHELQKGGTHFLEVRQSNQAAQELYNRLGFFRVGCRKDYYQYPSEAAIVMRRK